MKIKLLLAAAALVLTSGIAAAQSVPYNKPEIRKIDLCEKYKGSKCLQKRKLTAAENKEMMRYLQSVDYPGKINVDSRANFTNVSFGWKEVGSCTKVPLDRRSLYPNMSTGNVAIDQARVTYCKARKQGWPIPKPVITYTENRSKVKR